MCVLTDRSEDLVVVRFFFFSSRRRHTRCSRDWSSDVCSSDLGIICRHVLIAAGSLLEAQSVRLQAPVLPVGTLVPLATLWHFNGAGIGFPQRDGNNRWAQREPIRRRQCFVQSTQQLPKIDRKSTRL